MQVKNISQLSQYLLSLKDYSGSLLRDSLDGDVMSINGDKFYEAPILIFNINGGSIVTTFAPNVALNIVGTVKPNHSDLRTTQDACALAAQAIISKLVSDGLLTEDDLEDITLEPIEYGDDHLVGYNFEFVATTRISYCG